MSNLFGEHVPVVPALSMSRIEKIGESVLQALQPDALNRPTPLDLQLIVDYILPVDCGIFVSPAREKELENRLGATDFSGESTEILIAEETWNNLFKGGRIANRARATVAHEISHAFLHEKVMRSYVQRASLGEYVLNRMPRNKLRAFEDPEWQAWALAGCLLMPRKTINQLGPVTIDQVSVTYEVSYDFAKKHLKRLKLIK